MVNKELQNYIDKSRQAGKTDDQIRQDLLGAGWGESDINELLPIKKEEDRAVSKPHQLKIIRLILIALIVSVLLSTLVLIYYDKSLAFKLQLPFGLLIIEIGKIHYTELCIGIKSNGPEFIIDKERGYIVTGTGSDKSNIYCSGIGITVAMHVW